MGRVVGSLTGPCYEPNSGAGDILEDQLFAYAVATSIAVVDLPNLQMACVLQGGHARSPVTAVSWNPECHSRDESLSGQVRLASGDRDGNVVVWDVLRMCVVCKLGNPNSSAEDNLGVKSLAWILKDCCLLAVAMGPATLVVWDIQGAAILWRKELQGVGSLHSLCVDALDRRCMCASSDTGVCVIADFQDIRQNQVQVKQYRVTSRVPSTSTQPTANVHCVFPGARDLLLVMLSKEMILFDIEFRQPICSFRLPSTSSPFRKILTVTGKGVSAGGGIEGGIDEIHCLHEDGQLSVWCREPSTLSFSCTSTSKLLPDRSRHSASSGASLTITTVAASIWRSISGNPIDSVKNPLPRQINDCLLRNPSLLVMTVMSNGQLWQWDVPLRTYQGTAPTTVADKNKTEENTNALTSKTECMATDTEFQPASTLPVEAESRTDGAPFMCRTLMNLPSTVTTLAVLPKPLLQTSLYLEVASPKPSKEEGNGVAPTVDPTESSDVEAKKKKPPPLRLDSNPDNCYTGSTSTPLIAVVTSGGSLEIVSVSRGCVTPVSLEVTKSFSLHNQRSRSVRWLGCSPLAVSFCTEKTEHGWNNSLVVIDVRTGEAAPFREFGSENAPMLGIRTSPSGRYILLLLKDSPAEIWMVSGLRNVHRGRQVEIPFTAVEWGIPDGPAYDPMHIEDFENWGNTSGEDWEDGVSIADFPPETLVFSVNDGRAGTFRIKGKQVLESKLRRPLWGALPNGDPAALKCTAVAALGSHVILGDVEGNLTHWDMASGRSRTIPSNCGPIRRLQIAPAGTPEIKGKLAILSATWQCSIWEMDDLGVLSQTSFHSSNRYLDLAWIPSPMPSPPSSLLAAVTEDGNISIVDADVCTVSSPAEKSPVQDSPGALSSPEEIYSMWNGTVLGGNPWLSSSLLLPSPLRLLLRLLLQVGTPLSVLQYVVDCSKMDGSLDDEIEKEIFARFPDEVLSFSWARPDAQPALAELDSPVNRARADDDPSQGNDVDGFEMVLPSRVSPHRKSGDCPDHEKHDRSATRQPVAGASLRRTRNMSLASEVLASYETTETQSKGFLRKMKSVMKKKINRQKGAQIDKTLRATTEWGEESCSVENSVMLPSCESILDVLRALATVRCQGNLLLPEEWQSYGAAFDSGSTAARMVVAAQVSGCLEEVEFWLHLPKTLAKVRHRANEAHQWTSPIETDEERNNDQSACLWTESMSLSSSKERIRWHESLARASIESHPELQDRRLLEYVCVGDYNTAVGFLLASSPEASTRYYRDSLCAFALSASQGSVGADAAKISPLHLQVAKVVSAHAASVSDSLLGVPLLCSAGLFHESVRLLQEVGLWRYAATLTAHKLEGEEHALSCLRWAQHVLSEEGSIWRSAGILVSGGCLKEALRVFKNAGYSDCAAAFCACCEEAGLMRAVEVPTGEANGSVEIHKQMFDALALRQFTRIGKPGKLGHRRLTTSEEEQESLLEEVNSGFVVYCKRLMSVF